MATFTINRQDDNDGDNNSGLNISRNGNNLTITINSPTVANPNFATQDILIDTDNNPHTGYSTARFNYIGAEYLIEGNRLYSHRGGGWRWNYVGRVSRTINGQTLTVTANTADMNIGNNIRATASLNNRQWRVMQRFGIGSFELNGGNNHRLSLREYSQILTDEIRRPATAIAFSPDRNYIMVEVNEQETLWYHIYDVRGDELREVGSVDDMTMLQDHGTNIYQIRFINNSTVKYVLETYPFVNGHYIKRYQIVEYNFLTGETHRSDISSALDEQSASIVAIPNENDAFIVLGHLAGAHMVYYTHIEDAEHVRLNYRDIIDSEMEDEELGWTFRNFFIHGDILSYQLIFHDRDNSDLIWWIENIRYNLLTHQEISRERIQIY